MSDAPTVPMKDDGSLRAQAPSVPTEGHEAAVLADLRWAVYTSAYSVLRDYDNHPSKDRGLIAAGDVRIPNLIADGVVERFSPMIAATQQATGEGKGARWAMEQAREVLSRLQYAKNAKDFDESRLMGVAILDAALSTQQAVSPPEGVERFVTGSVWKDDETDEDGGEIWTSEVQVIGGHSYIATVHASSEAEATQRADAICRTLNALPPAPDAIGEDKGAGE